MAMKFMQAAHAVGIPDAPLYCVVVDHFGLDLLEAAKRHARFLEKHFAGLAHRAALEVVAKSAGFAHWHAFQTTAQRLIKDFAAPDHGSRPMAGDDVFAPFLQALPLLVRVPQDVAASDEERTGLEKLAHNLGRHLEQPVDTLLNILAKLNDADNWKELTTRRPEATKTPLYVFHHEDDIGGRFEWSPACQALVEEMDALWQQYEERPKHEQQTARRFIENIVKKRPDFLEGWLALATIQEMEDEEGKAGTTYSEGIRRANALLPKAYRSQIIWGVTENRFYHRLLYCRMRWCMRRGLVKEAMTLARRQLRLNPNDNLGVRITMPLLCAAAGDAAGAHKGLARLLGRDVWGDGHMLLVASLCHLMLGDLRNGQIFFLRALFELPALRPLILENTVPDMQDDQWHRGNIPDFESLWEDYCFACDHNSEAEATLRTLLDNTAVLLAERTAESQHRTAVAALRQSHNMGTMEAWCQAAQRLANELVEHL